MRLTKGLRIFLCCLLGISLAVIFLCQSQAWAENKTMVPAKTISALTGGVVKKPMSTKEVLSAYVGSMSTTAHAPQFQPGVLKAMLIIGASGKSKTSGESKKRTLFSSKFDEFKKGYPSLLKVNGLKK